MAFLQLNGYTIPILRGGEAEPIPIGSTERAFDGTLLRERRQLLRKWRFETKPVDLATAEAIVGLIEGTGQLWAFDGDAYSTKGRGTNTSGTEEFTIRPGYGADGSLSTNWDGEPEGVYQSTGSLATDPAATNILDATARDCEATTNWNAVAGGVIGLNASSQWQALRSIRCTVTNPGDGIETDAVACSSSTDYTGSAYIKTSDTAADTYDVSLVGDVSGVLATSTLTISHNGWHRVWVTGTTGGSDTTIKLRLVAGTGITNDFFTDACQVEQSDYPTSWYDGARSNNGNISWPVAYRGKGFSLLTWFNVVDCTLPDNGGLINWYHSAQPATYFYAYINSSTEAVYLRYFTPGSSTTTLSSIGTNVVDDAWHHAAVTVDPATRLVSLYVDGVAKDSATISISDIDAMVDLDTLRIGHRANINTGAAEEWLIGVVDNTHVVPYCMPADMVSAFATDEVGPGLHPRINVQGDLAAIRSYGITVNGRVTGMSYAPRYDSTGTFKSNYQSITFELETVDSF